MPKQISFNVKKNFFNEVYLPYIETDTRFNVFYGGAGSGKSVFVIQKLILKMLKYSDRTLLVIRKVTNSIRDSVFQEFISQMTRMKVYKLCKVVWSNFSIILPNGSKILFKGIDDPEKLKSISGIDDIFIEEATEVTLDDFSQLNLRLRSDAPNQQIHLCFNPVSKANWCYIYWFKDGTPDNTTVVHTTWKDNRFLPKSYIDALEDLKTKNPVYYKIYAEGYFATLDKLVYPNTEVVDFNWLVKLKENKCEGLFGLDFGYVNDPTGFIALLLDDVRKEIWIFDEHYEKGMLNDQIAQMIINKGYAKETITADSAEQKSIYELRKLGIKRVRASRKGKDSIMNGIQYLNQYKIYVHPRCKNVIEEFENYSWKKDKNTNEYINTPIDDFNHLLDALRYAVEEKMRKATLGKASISKSALGF